jgi:uncharacterized membrane protein YqjE
MSAGYGSPDFRSPPPPGDARYETGAGSGESIGSILGGLLGDLQGMVRGEIALARAEVKEDVSTMGRAVAQLATAAIFGLTGFIFLMLGATYLLNIWMRMWIAAAIVGAVLLAVAAILGMNGKNKLSASNLKPEQTIDSVKETTEWAKQQIKSDVR